jgi:Caenorhabditis protein of unknown function, DUF268
MLRRLVRTMGYRIVQVADLGVPRRQLDLSGDRDVEWAWIGAKMPEQAGRVLDLGPATSSTPLIAAFNAKEVIGLDLSDVSVPFAVPNLSYKRGDILAGDLPDGVFDTIVNCSTTEHIGLSGRYGSSEAPDGDLTAMRLLRERMAGPAARMILTIPVGRDKVARPFHRIYGRDRLPRLLDRYRTVTEAYFAKIGSRNVWQPVARDVALDVEGSESFYALGLFVLAPQ